MSITFPLVLLVGLSNLYIDIPGTAIIQQEKIIYCHTWYLICLYRTPWQMLLKHTFIHKQYVIADKMSHVSYTHKSNTLKYKFRVYDDTHSYCCCQIKKSVLTLNHDICLYYINTSYSCQHLISYHHWRLGLISQMTYELIAEILWKYILSRFKF